MDWTVILTGIISAISGGGLAGYLTFRLNNRKEDTNDFQILLDERKEETKLLREQLEVLRENLNALEKKEFQNQLEIQHLRNQLTIFESNHTDIPLPIWMKDIDGKMIFLNSHYEEYFLKPIGKTANDYIGKYDLDVWGEEIHRQFKTHDKKVIRSKQPLTTIEKIVDPITKKEVFVKVMKYPRMYMGKVIGVGGILLGVEANKEDLEKWQYQPINQIK